jgi:hypothetical protein
MNNKNKHHGASRQNDPIQTCQTCIYHDHNAADSRDNCLRFARFVDHLLHEALRDCDYWSPALTRP